LSLGICKISNDNRRKPIEDNPGLENRRAQR